MYVPTLAEAIVWATGNGTYTGAELKGIAVGNGCRYGAQQQCTEPPTPLCCPH